MQKEWQYLAITNFAIPSETVDVGNDQWLPKFLGERVMGNFKMKTRVNATWIQRSI